MSANKVKAKIKNKLSSNIFFILFIVISSIALIFLTTHFLDAQTRFTFLQLQRSHIIAVEVGILSIVLIELIGRALITRAKKSDIAQFGISIRAIFRVISYSALSIALISILASNPTLALSVGAFSGIVIGFASQSIIGNLIASLILVLARPFIHGDTISVAGTKGKIIEVGVIYTKVESEENILHIPNIFLLTNIIQRAKKQTK